MHPLAKYLLNSYYVLGNMLKSKDSRMRKKILATLLDLASSGETDSGPANNEDVRGSKCAHDVEQKTNSVHDRGFWGLRDVWGLREDPLEKVAVS